MSKKLFVDLDGVIVDFFNAAPFITKGKINDNMFNLLQVKDGWDLLYEHGEEFWQRLKWTYDGKVLWDYVKNHNPYILSAFPHSEFANHEHREFAIYGKIKWVTEKLGDHMIDRTIICHKDEKQLFANGNILIDDYEKNIINWINYGGIGILHTDAQSTINKLKGVL